MRSRLACVCSRVTITAAGLVLGLVVTASTAGAAGSTGTLAQPPGPLESLGPVGLVAVLLGVAGMVAGVFRKKKIQPENQRKS